jgi:hypothetical protein
MEILSNSFPVQYAVIQVHQSDGGTERFVMRYQYEQDLRQFLDKRSIVATGLVSRDEAMRMSLTAGIENRRPLLNLMCSCLRSLNPRTLCRLQDQGIALGIMNNIAHLAGAAVHKIQSRLTHDRQRLEPAVQ